MLRSWLRPYLAVRLAAAYARADSNNYTNSADALGVMSVVFFGCGLPSCYLIGVLVARLSRLPWPWLVSAAGLAVGAALGWAVRAAGIGWTVLALVLAYASAAVTAAMLVPSARASVDT